MISALDVPYLPCGVRIKHDAVRGFDVLLGPERVVMLDEIGKDILSHLDGVCDLGDIARTLSMTYNAPLDVIEPDVAAFLQDLIEKGFVHVTAH